MFKKAFYNTSAQLTGRIFSACCAFLTTLLLARSLGSFYFGEYIKVIAVVTLFYPLIDFGLNTLYLRDAHSHEETYFGSFTTLRIVLAIFSFLLYGLGAFVLAHIFPGFAGVGETVGIGGIALVGYALVLSLHVLFQARLDYNKITISLGIGSLVNLFLVVLAYSRFSPGTHDGVVLALIFFASSVWVTALVSLILLKQPLKFAITPGLWKKFMFASLPLGLTLVFNYFYFRLDTLILAIYRPSSEVGAYAFAYKFFEFALVVPSFFMNSLYPELVKQTDAATLKQNFKHIKTILLAGSLVVTLGLFIGAPLLTLVKADYAESVLLLRLLALGLPLFYLSSPYMWWYVLKFKQHSLVYIYGVALVVTIGINLLFIPIFGAVGAAITTSLTELLVLILVARGEN